MKAWQVLELGEPRDVLTLAEVPDPVPAPGQGAGPGARRRGELPRRAHVPRRLPGPPAATVHPRASSCAGDGRGRGRHRGLTRDRARRPAHRRRDRRRLRRADADERGERACPPRPAWTTPRRARSSSRYQTRVVRAAPAGRLAAGETLLVHAAAGGVGSGAGPAGQGGRRPGHRGGRRRGEGRGGPRARRGRGDRPEHSGLRRGGQGGHRGPRAPNVGLRPGRRRHVRAVHQVHRVRGPDPWIIGFAGGQIQSARAEPRAGQKLLDRRACTGACTRARTLS